MDKDWEEGLPWLLLATREVSQESTGFSPNYLVFGHRVHGLLSVLALLPIVGSPFQAKFQGSNIVVRQCTDHNYLVGTPERRKAHKLCHVNLLKLYVCSSEAEQ
jgi:hypothetical protein